VVTLIWVPGHCGILGNEVDDKLARQASAMPLPDPEPLLRIPKCSAREAIRTWTESHLPGHRRGKLFLGWPCKKRADDLLK
jgi:ribonuclease HI